MTPAGFDILWEEGPCLVALKPPGLLTQAPPGIDSLEVRVRRFLAARDGANPPPYLAVVHRLDRPVSGAILLALHRTAARKLSRQFEFRHVSKRYGTLVEGCVEPESGTWTDWMRKLPDNPRSEIVTPDHPDAQLAILHYRVIGRSADVSLLEIELETGRTHQIRLQSSAHGHPIVGDFLYGSTRSFGPETNDERARWIALHARSLEFRHPDSQADVKVLAPLPAIWRTSCASLGDSVADWFAS